MLYDGGNVINDPFKLIDLLALPHDTDERLRAGCTDEDAAIAAEFFFSSTDGVTDEFIVFPAILAVDLDIFENLWICDHEVIKFRHGLSGFTQNLQRLHRSDEAVACRIEFWENDMAGLFTADGVVMLQHFFKNIAVAHLRGYRLTAVFLQGFAKAKIAHDSADDHILMKTSFFLHLEGIDEHQMVTVHDLSFFIDKETAVCIAVIGDAAVRAKLQDLLLQCLDMRGAAAVIDIHTIWFMEDRSDFCPKLFQHRRQEITRCAIRRVRHDLKPFEIALHSRKDMSSVLISQFGAVLDHADLIPCRTRDLFIMTKDIFDIFLSLIRQLIAIFIKELDSIIWEWIV